MIGAMYPSEVLTAPPALGRTHAVKSTASLKSHSISVDRIVGQYGVVHRAIVELAGNVGMRIPYTELYRGPRRFVAWDNRGIIDEPGDGDPASLPVRRRSEISGARGRDRGADLRKLAQ